jgi:hypothetical protein
VGSNYLGEKEEGKERGMKKKRWKEEEMEKKQPGSIPHNSLIHNRNITESEDYIILPHQRTGIYHCLRHFSF